MKDLPVNVKEARVLNAPFYFTGKSCKYGHISKRLTSNKTCYECDLLISRKKSKERIRSVADYNEKKENILLQQKQYRQNNRYKVNAKSAKRRAIKLQATPHWADLDKIKEIYKNCPEGFHVDHIYPLKGKEVCGLHVEYNLQYLTASENTSKGNKVAL